MTERATGENTPADTSTGKTDDAAKRRKRRVAENQGPEAEAIERPPHNRAIQKPPSDRRIRGPFEPQE